MPTQWWRPGAPAASPEPRQQRNDRWEIELYFARPAM